MRFLSRSTHTITVGVVPLLLLACGRSAAIEDAAAVTGAGGSSSGVGGTSGSDSRPAADGALPGGQVGAGGAWGSGGAVGVGGAPGTGGQLGGAVGMGGMSGLGGRPGTGGAMGVGGNAGGVFSAGGGTSGMGGSVAAGGSGGERADGAFGAGGATGGSSGSGGSSGTVAYPARFVGNIDTRGSIRTDFATYWDEFTPENAGKWAAIQPTQSTFNWTSLDAMYKYCDEQNIIFKEHTFVWGSSQPGWMSSLTTTTGPEVVKTWMKTFCQRYPNTRLIDVVNEPPPHTTPPFKNVIGGSGSTGWDWIVNSFVWAHEACPNAVLILNDYNNAEYSSDVQHTIDIVKAIQQVGAPIHAVGCQTHSPSKLPSTTLKANIDLITSSTGLPVYITEYDINLSDDAQQKQQYEDHFTMFWSNPNVKGVTVWGYVVGTTWQTNTGIMASDGTMRPAMSWLMDFLGR